MESAVESGSSDIVLATVTCPAVNSVAVVYRVNLPAVQGNPGGQQGRDEVIYGAYGDRYTSADGFGPNVLGVVHVPGGPLESPTGVPTITNDKLLPFPFASDVGDLVAQSFVAYKDATVGLNYSSILLNNLDSSGRGFGDFEIVNDLARGLFLAPTNEALNPVLFKYGLNTISELLEEPYLTAVRRLLQFHTFPVVSPEAQDVPPALTTGINLLTILNGTGTKELRANDGWVLQTWVCSHPVPASCSQQLVVNIQKHNTRNTPSPPFAVSPRSRSQAIPALSLPRAWVR